MRVLLDRPLIASATISPSVLGAPAVVVASVHVDQLGAQRHEVADATAQDTRQSRSRAQLTRAFAD